MGFKKFGEMNDAATMRSSKVIANLACRGKIFMVSLSVGRESMQCRKMHNFGFCRRTRIEFSGHFAFAHHINPVTEAKNFR